MLRKKLASRRLNETKLREDGGEARLPIAARSNTMEGIVAAFTADKEARTGAEKVQLQNLFTNGMNFNREGRFVACCAQGEGGRRAVVRFNFAHELEIYRFCPYARNTDKLHVVWQDLKTPNITAISSVYRIACNQPGFLSYPRIQ